MKLFVDSGNIKDIETLAVLASPRLLEPLRSPQPEDARNHGCARQRAPSTTSCWVRSRFMRRLVARIPASPGLSKT